jgi:putative spermidine/putrescine transport system ATP-binding protein
VAVISTGRLQQCGTPFQVYAHPSNRFVAEFMGLVNVISGKVIDVRDGCGTVELGAGFRLDVGRLDAQPGDSVDVAIRPENIRLASQGGATAAHPATITGHVFLGNLREYSATLPSGQVLRVQTHPQQQFEVGESVVVEVDATDCSVFRRTVDETNPGQR